MNITFVGLETLKALYERGHLTAAGLTAIAPITWIAENYPELLDQPEKALEAITVEAVKPPKTCDRCIHYSSVHSCCMTRIENDTYLAMKPESIACKDFEGVELPPFLKKG